MEIVGGDGSPLDQIFWLANMLKLMTWRFLEQILNPSSLLRGPSLWVRSKCNVNVWKVFTFCIVRRRPIMGCQERVGGAPPILRGRSSKPSNIAISCSSLVRSRWYVHAAQNEPIMNIFQALSTPRPFGARGGLTKPKPIRLAASWFQVPGFFASSLLGTRQKLDYIFFNFNYNILPLCLTSMAQWSKNFLLVAL